MSILPPTTSETLAGSPTAWSVGDLQGNPHLAPDKAQRVQKMFAAIARAYDLNNRIHSFGRDQAWRRAAVRLCKVLPTDRVLDVACGTGDLTEAFAAAGPSEVTGLDFTAEMLDVAHEKSNYRRLRLHANTNVQPTYIQGDAMNLPFDDATFDIVSIAWGIRNISDPARAVREFRRVLRPGGRLVVLEFSQPHNTILRKLNHVYTAKIMPLTATLIARDRSGAYRYLPQSVATFFNPGEFSALLAVCGFAQIQAHPLTFGVCTAYLAHAEAVPQFDIQNRNPVSSSR